MFEELKEVQCGWRVGLEAETWREMKEDEVVPIVESRRPWGHWRVLAGD